MNYQKIHDEIIHRAKNRILPQETYTENHHVHPICENGLQSGETVKLLIKEHKLVHKLRYKYNRNIGNLLAYFLMKNTSESRVKHNKLAATLGAKAYHKKFKEKNYDEYILNQKKAGVSGGNKCVSEKLGYFSLSEEELNLARKKGNETLVKNKLGMFSDEYREKHKLMLHKKIKTPEGIFISMTDAANFYMVSRATITYRINNDREAWKDWNYIINNGDTK
jgi:hypothetical protein